MEVIITLASCQFLYLKNMQIIICNYFLRVINYEILHIVKLHCYSFCIFCLMLPHNIDECTYKQPWACLCLHDIGSSVLAWQIDRHYRSLSLPPLLGQAGTLCCEPGLRESPREPASNPFACFFPVDSPACSHSPGVLCYISPASTGTTTDGFYLGGSCCSVLSARRLDTCYHILLRDVTLLTHRMQDCIHTVSNLSLRCWNSDNFG